MPSTAPNSTIQEEHAWAKVPALTLGFWLIKIAATTLGETAGDAVTMSESRLLGWHRDICRHFYCCGDHPNTHRAIPPVAVLGCNRRNHDGRDHLGRFLRPIPGVGYLGGSTLLFALLMVSLFVWHRSLGSVSINHLDTRKAENFYWATILFSQTLGTALGDWVADPATGWGLGYEGGALLFAAGLAVVIAAYWWTNISRTALFWAAFILTRPLGATVGDLLDKPVANGGLALSRYTASAALMVCMLALIFLLPQRAEKIERA